MNSTLNRTDSSKDSFAVAIASLPCMIHIFLLGSLDKLSKVIEVQLKEQMAGNAILQEQITEGVEKERKSVNENEKLMKKSKMDDEKIHLPRATMELMKSDLRRKTQQSKPEKKRIDEENDVNSNYDVNDGNDAANEMSADMNYDVNDDYGHEKNDVSDNAANDANKLSVPVCMTITNSPFKETFTD